MQPHPVPQKRQELVSVRVLAQNELLPERKMIARKARDKVGTAAPASHTGQVHGIRA